MTPERSNPATEFAARLWQAMDDEKKSQTRTEREAKLKRGYLTQLKNGKIRMPGPEVIRALADYLNVGFEWLAIGRGPMRTLGWAPSPFEEAQLVCQRARTRTDAIVAAATRHANDDAEMTAIDWILAIDTEARRLDRAGVQRPEETIAIEKTVKRRGAKKQRLLRELAQLDAARAKPTQPERAPRSEPARSKKVIRKS